MSFNTTIRLLASAGQVLLALFLVSASAPSEPLNGASLTPISSEEGALIWHPVSSALGTGFHTVSLATAIADHGHAMRTCDPGERDALPVTPAPTVAWCWDRADAASGQWTPQGIAVGRTGMVASAWHRLAADRTERAKVAFVDMGRAPVPRYQWFSLVIPSSSGRSFSAAKTHAGGIAWVGDRLYVSAVDDGNDALLVFSTARVIKARTAGYVLPEIGRYTYARGACSVRSDVTVPCFSSISLDPTTTPPSIVTSEYFTSAFLHGRVFRYRMGKGGRLAPPVVPSEAFRSGVSDAQGVVSHAGNWYIAHSSAEQPGQLWTQSTQRSTSTVCTRHGRTTRSCWAFHPEGLGYGGPRGLVWSQSEWSSSECAAHHEICGRALFAVRLWPVTSGWA